MRREFLDSHDDGAEVDAMAASEIQLRDRSAPMGVSELKQWLAMQRVPVPPASRAVSRRRDHDDSLDDLALLDDDQDPASPDSVISNEVRDMHTQRLIGDLRIDTHIGRRLAECAIEALGRVWRYDTIIARLLAKPTRRNLEDVRKVELAREVAHRTMRYDLELIRHLKMPGGLQVQVAASATEGGQVNVAVAPGPIPKRRRC